MDLRAPSPHHPELMARVVELETDSAARAAFFSKPVLAPGAHAAVATMTDAIRGVVTHVLESIENQDGKRSPL